MTLAVTVVVLLVVVALLAAGGALDRTRRAPRRVGRVPRGRVVVEEPVVRERVVERVVEQPDARL